MHSSTTTYSVSTQVYEGPLDLLLNLIEHAELDITKLSLAQVTDQFLTYIHQMQFAQAEEVSSFLVIASKLLQIKSEILLPHATIHEPGEEDLGEALVQQLIIYKKFKDIAALMGVRESIGQRTYLRLAATPSLEGTFILNGWTFEDLAAAARLVLVRLDNTQSLNSVVSPQIITIRQKIHQITLVLKQFGQTTFTKILETSSSKIEVVVTFLALLELIKQRVILVKQDALFGEINIQSVGTWGDNEEFELEFGE